MNVHYVGLFGSPVQIYKLVLRGLAGVRRIVVSLNFVGAGNAGLYTGAILNFNLPRIVNQMIVYTMW